MVVTKMNALLAESVGLRDGSSLALKRCSTWPCSSLRLIPDAVLLAGLIELTCRLRDLTVQRSASAVEDAACATKAAHRASSCTTRQNLRPQISANSEA